MNQLYASVSSASKGLVNNTDKFGFLAARDCALPPQATRMLILADIRLCLARRSMAWLHNARLKAEHRADDGQLC
jgi:hypothetical protein